MTYFQAQRRVGAQGIYWTELTTDSLDDAKSRTRTMYVQTGVDCRVISDAGTVVFRVRRGGKVRPSEPRQMSQKKNSDA